MSRPLLITDCDEVLLHMVSRADRSTVPVAEMWPLLDGFFATEMHRQTLVPGAGEALGRLAGRADIVVLTNLKEQCRADRIAQLAALDIHHEVVCNQGGKGDPVTRILAERRPSVAVFVDDLSVHHDSVAHAAPGVWRLHMIADPEVAAVRPKARSAHARIDDWAEAEAWIARRFADGVAADA